MVLWNTLVPNLPQVHLTVEVFVGCWHENPSSEFRLHGAVITFGDGNGTMTANRTVTWFDVMRFAPITKCFAVELRTTIRDDMFWSSVFGSYDFVHCCNDLFG